MRKLIILAILLVIATPAGAAFKATVVVAEGAFSQIRRQAAGTKQYLLVQRALMVAPTVSASVPLAVIQHLSTVIPSLTTLAATPGLAAYAKTQLNDTNYDIVAESNAMRTGMVNTMANLITMFPKDGNGFLLYQTIDAAGVITTRTFTAAQVAPAVALIDTLIATID